MVVLSSFNVFHNLGARFFPEGCGVDTWCLQFVCTSKPINVGSWCE